MIPPESYSGDRIAFPTAPSRRCFKLRARPAVEGFDVAVALAVIVRGEGGALVEPPAQQPAGRSGVWSRCSTDTPVSPASSGGKGGRGGVVGRRATTAAIACDHAPGGRSRCGGDPT